MSVRTRGAMAALLTRRSRRPKADFTSSRSRARSALLPTSARQGDRAPAAGGDPVLRPAPPRRSAGSSRRCRTRGCELERWRVRSRGCTGHEGQGDVGGCRIFGGHRRLASQLPAGQRKEDDPGEKVEPSVRPRRAEQPPLRSTLHDEDRRPRHGTLVFVMRTRYVPGSRPPGTVTTTHRGSSRRSRGRRGWLHELDGRRAGEVRAQDPNGSNPSSAPRRLGRPRATGPAE